MCFTEKGALSMKLYLDKDHYFKNSNSFYYLTLSLFMSDPASDIHERELKIF
jgi:hypothetical protein